MLSLTELPELPGLSNYIEGEDPKRRINDLDCNSEPMLHDTLVQVAKETARLYTQGGLANGKNYSKVVTGEKIGDFTVFGRFMEEIPKGTFLDRKFITQAIPSAISIQTTFHGNGSANSGIRLYTTPNPNVFQLVRVLGGNYQPASDQNHIDTYLPAALAFAQELSDITGDEYTIDAQHCIQNYAVWNRGRQPQLEPEIHIKPSVDLATTTIDSARKQIADTIPA